MGIVKNFLIVSVMIWSIFPSVIRNIIGATKNTNGLIIVLNVIERVCILSFQSKIDFWHVSTRTFFNLLYIYYYKYIRSFITDKEKKRY